MQFLHFLLILFNIDFTVVNTVATILIGNLHHSIETASTLRNQRVILALSSSGVESL